MSLEDRQKALKLQNSFKSKKIKKKRKAVHKVNVPIITKQKPLKVEKNINDLPDKHKAFLLLKENGEKPKTIAKTLGYHPDYAYHLGKALSKYNLKDKTMVLSASQAIKKFLKGKTFGEIEEIKDSTVLGAVKMVYDRIEPAVQVSQSRNINLNADVTPELAAWADEVLEGLGVIPEKVEENLDKTIDITPENEDIKPPVESK